MNRSKAATRGDAEATTARRGCRFRCCVASLFSWLHWLRHSPGTVHEPARRSARRRPLTERPASS